MRKKLNDPGKIQIKESIIKRNVNKTLDEFATYKSSSTLSSRTFTPTMKQQNHRKKCIEAVGELLDSRDCKTSYDVAYQFRKEETYFHVFKKNQIGGVREILILPISNRIRINILETISRNICSFDQRETLTHGSKKFENMKSILYKCKKLQGPRASIHITMDKSRWGPSFVPIQFLYLFSPFVKELGDHFNYIADLLIRHQNKSCVLPDRLTRAWYQDDNTHEHKFPGLQSLKRNF